jgi:tRNA-guanine family transglycosylase
MIKDHNNRVIYIPAYSVVGLQGLLKNTHHCVHSEKTLRYYSQEEPTVFDYDAILVSAGHRYKEVDLSKKLGIDKTKTLMVGDSGGYQIATGAMKFTDDLRYKIFTWLEENTNYAMNLDLPLYVTTNTKQTEMSKEEKIRISKDNFKYFSENRSGKTKYLNILHGRTEEDLNKWYEAIKEFDFEGGWAIGSAGNNPLHIIKSFFYLWEKGEIHKLNEKENPILHILGFSKVKEIHYIEYLQKKLNEMGFNITMTFDSSSPDMSAAHGGYIKDILVTGIKYITISNKENYTNNKNKMPCDCPICKDITYSEFVGKPNKNGGMRTEAYTHMSLHNLYKVLEYKRKVEKCIHEDENYNEFFSTAKGKYGGKIQSRFKIIDDSFTRNNPFTYIMRKGKSWTRVFSDSELNNMKSNIRNDWLIK